MSKSFMRYLRVALPAVVLATSCATLINELTFITVATTLPASNESTTTTIAPSERVETVVTNNLGTINRVVRDFSRIYESRAQCGRTPEQCPVNEMTVKGSPLHSSLTEIMNERIVGNLYTRSDAGKLRVRIESVEIIDTTRATVHTCIFDSVVLFDSGQIDGPADDIVFDDSVISAFMVWNVQLDNGTWKWVSSTATQRKIEETYVDSQTDVRNDCRIH
jgi:hypothetical protein